MKIFVLAICLLGSMNMYGAEKNNVIPKPIQTFKENISACLLNKNKGCLKKHIQEKIYFFEQVDFGCHTTDTDKNYSSALEFSECTMTSQKRNDTCGSKALTLLEALKDCFSDAKSKFKDNYFYGPGGYVCYLEKEKGHWMFESIHCQP